MGNKFLIINGGSASKKYALYDGGACLFLAHFEKSEKGEGFMVALRVGGGTEKEERTVTADEFAGASSYVVAEIVKHGIVAGADEIDAIVLRVVAPGTYFMEDRVIDDEYVKQLVIAAEGAPLHTAPLLTELNYVRTAFPGKKLVGISDSAFHQTMPAFARRYAIVAEDARALDLYRFGYHGISVESIVGKAAQFFASGDPQGGTGRAVPEKMIVCHLGSGSSIVALRDGKTVDASMGFTPLEGLPMGTRVGNIDAGAVTFLMKKKGMDAAAAEAYLNKQCGLLGLSGATNDVRELIALEAGGHTGAHLALETFIYSIKKYIGAYTAALGGLDALVFTAAIGERSFIMRGRICEGLAALGIVIDKAANDAVVSRDALISAADSGVRVAVLGTDEMGLMAKRAREL